MMLRTTLTFGILVVGLGGGLAAASQMSDFGDFFPERPCQDGWAGCIVGGFEIDAGVAHDSAG